MSGSRELGAGRDRVLFRTTGRDLPARAAGLLEPDRALLPWTLTNKKTPSEIKNQFQAACYRNSNQGLSDNKLSMVF